MSISGRRATVAAAVAVVTVLPMLILASEGGFAMADSPLKRGWEWRAGRVLEQRAGLRLVRIHKEGGGLFGIGRSPSLGGALPDAQRVEAEVIVVDRSGPVHAGARIEFRIPKVELRGAGPGALVAVGMIGDNVVCLAPAPADVNEAALAGWLPQAPCA
jgi:hypothetical protein